MTDREFAALVTSQLLEDTDVLTGNDEGTPSMYYLASDDVEYLVLRILEIADGLL